MERRATEENLIGVYLHSSIAMGCFNPSRSDIDLLVVVKNKLHVITSKRIARLSLSAYHTDNYESDENYLCGGFEDEDLAAHGCLEKGRWRMGGYGITSCFS
jgi:predicted nucleotidyltransferase